MVDLSPPLDDPQGVAALAPEFDLAVSSAPRRSAPPIGSLSPQGTPYGEPHPKHPAARPARSPSLVAADFLHECHPQNFAAARRLAAPADIPTDIPVSSPPPFPHHPVSALLRRRPPAPVPASVPASAPSLRHSPDFDLFGLANLDLGPPVFDPAPAPLPPLRSPSYLHRSPPPPSASPALTDPPRPASPPLPSLPQSPPLSSGQPQPPSPARSARDLQQHPTRCLLVRNIPPGIDDDEIRCLLQQHGPLRDLGAQQRCRGGRGSMLATFYDLRHARSAARALDATVHFGRRLEVRFQSPPEGNAAGNEPLSLASAGGNQGTLVVFNLDNGTSAEEIRAVFSRVGDVKEIRATPNKKHHKFVEFYDVRDAERAMRILNKTEVGGKRIKIEISRPGGRAASLIRHSPGPGPARGVHFQQTQLHAQQQVMQHIHQQPRRFQQGQQPSHVQYPHDGAAYRSLSPRHPASDNIHSSSLPHGALLSPILPSMQTARQAAFSYAPDLVLPFEDQSALNQHGAASHLIGSTSFEDAIPSLQPDPYAGAFRHRKSGDESDPIGVHTGYDANGDRSAGTRSAEQRASDLHQLYMSHVSDLNKSPNVVAPAQGHGPRYAADSYIQALYHSTSSDDDGRRMLSPPSQSPRSPFGRCKTDAPGTDVSGIALHKGQFGDEAIGYNFTGHSQQGTSSQRSRKSLGHEPTVVAALTDRGYGSRPNSSGKGGSHIGPGHTAGNKSYCNQHQSSSKYTLDIRKVRSGEESRTALMIRNIPNKYNQKMLLSTLEEDHRGHFDFIYLPIDFKNKCNVGYAFINFTEVRFIEPFYNQFHGKKWGRFNSEKVCEITFARIQGRQQLIAHFQNSSLLLEDPKCRPVIFDARGRQEEFPIGSHVRTRRGPSSRDASHRTCDGSPPFSPPRQRGRS